MENYQTLQKDIIQFGKHLIEAAENTEPTDNGRALETLLDKGEREWMKLWEKFVPIDEPREIGQSMMAFLSHLEWISQQGEINGLRTGFDKLDQLIGGVKRGELIVLSSLEGLGKTSLAMNISMNVVRETENPVLIFGNESHWIGKMMAYLGNVDQSNLARGKLDDESLARLSSAVALLQERNNLYFYNAKWGSVNLIRRVARKAYQKKQSLKLIVIDDFDQLVQASTLSPAEIIAQIKALAKELEVPIIVVANHFSAGLQKEKRPTFADLLECYQFSHYADVSIMLYRDERYTNNSEMGEIVELRVLQKHQKDGYLKLKFDDKCASFTEYQE